MDFQYRDKDPNLYNFLIEITIKDNSFMEISLFLINSNSFKCLNINKELILLLVDSAMLLLQAIKLINLSIQCLSRAIIVKLQLLVIHSFIEINLLSKLLFNFLILNTLNKITLALRVLVINKFLWIMEDKLTQQEDKEKCKKLRTFKVQLKHS